MSDSDKETLGQIVDRLGVHPGAELALQHSTRGFAIMTGPHPTLPRADATGFFLIGNMSFAEVIGLLEAAKQNMLSDRYRQSSMEQALGQL